MRIEVDSLQSESVFGRILAMAYAVHQLACRQIEREQEKQKQSTRTVYAGVGE